MMKRHVLTGFILIVLLCLLVGGAAAAYFTDRASLGSSQEFVFGTVDIEVEKISGGDVTISFPDECGGEAAWRITNTGSKTAMMRARIIEEFQGSGGGEYIDAGSAWGVGSGVDGSTPPGAISPRFGGGNARYHVYNLGHNESEPLELKLGLGDNYTNVGSVYVWDNGTSIWVEAVTANSWRLKETHLYVGSTAPTKSAPGQLGNQRQPMSTRVTYQLPLPTGIQDDKVYIALHATIQERISGDYAGDPDIDLDVAGWTKGSDGYYYYPYPVSSGGTVDFELEFEIEKAWSGDYTLSLEAEAVQASHDAIDAVWPDNPLND